MSKCVCVVAAICKADNLNKQNFWSNAAQSACLSVLKSVSSDFSLKVLTSALTDSPFAKQLGCLGLQKLRTNFPVNNLSALTAEIKECNCVYLITDTDYSHANPVKEEVAIGRSVVDACYECRTPHLVYCTKMHVYASIGLRCDACDAKAHIADYITGQELPFTLLVVPFLYEDFLTGILKPKKTYKTSILKSVTPMGHIPIDTIGLRDFGACVKQVLENPQIWIGKTISLSGSKLPMTEYTRILTDVVYPIIIKDGRVTPEEFMELNLGVGAEDMANYFDYLTHEVQRNNIVTSQRLNEDLESFYDWAQRQQEKIKQMIKS